MGSRGLRGILQKRPELGGRYRRGDGTEKRESNRKRIAFSKDALDPNILEKAPKITTQNP